MDRGNEVPLRVGGVFAFAGLLGLAAVISFQPSADPEVNQVLVQSELTMAREQLASLHKTLQVHEVEAAGALAAKVESKAIARNKETTVERVKGDECPMIYPTSDPNVNKTEADKYSDPWETSNWKYGFYAVIVLGLVLLYAQIQEVREDSNPLATPSDNILHKAVKAIKSVDTFKQLCAYDPYKDGAQAPSGNAYRLLAVVGPDIFGITSHNHDGSNPANNDRTDGGYKCTLPNLIGYLVIVFMTLCILIMQIYLPYTLLTNATGGSQFVGFKLKQYYFDFPSRLGLQLVPLTLMSMKFFVKVEKVVREEFNQCMWLFKATLAGNIQFQVLGRPWSLFWITVSFVANTYIAVCMTFYVVLSICTYSGSDIMSFFLKVLGSLGLISFDDDIMGALPQWSGWYAEHTNQAGHPLGGHPMGCPADFFVGPESVRAGGDSAGWGCPTVYTQTVTVTTGDGEDGVLRFLEGGWFDKGTMTVQADTTQEGKKLLAGMKLTSVHGSAVSTEADLKRKLHTSTTTCAVELENHQLHEGITFEEDDKLIVKEVTAVVAEAYPQIKPGAELTHLHGNAIESPAHLKEITKVYNEQQQAGTFDDYSPGFSMTFLVKERGDSNGHVTLIFTMPEDTSLKAAKGDEELAKKLKDLEQQKPSLAKYVKIGLQFCEGCEELGFRLTGNMISAVMAEEGSAAFNAVDMSEVANGRADLGIEPYAPYKSNGTQPYKEDRIPYLYKSKAFSPEIRVEMDKKEEDRVEWKPPCTGLQPGMCILKINETTVNGFGDIARELRYIKGDNLNYSDMRYDEEKTEHGWANEWRGDEKILKRVEQDGKLRSKEFTIVCTRAGDEDSDFDDFTHGFIYMLIRVLLMFSLLFILISYWQKDCVHVGV